MNCRRCRACAAVPLGGAKRFPEAVGCYAESKVRLLVSVASAGGVPSPRKRASMTILESYIFQRLSEISMLVLEHRQ